MRKTLHLRSVLVVGASMAALMASAPAWAQTAGGNNGPTGGQGVAPASPGPSGRSVTGAPPAETSGRSQPSAAGESPRGGGAVIEELVVTAQKREEGIQNVPIAVSAFSNDSLKTQRIDGGNALLLAVPNVNFSRGNFGGFNFSIRGIGTKLVATGADAATGIHLNNVPLTDNNLADTDFYDVERVEVLRGPQGTQFGRNSTGGLVNIITAKPTDREAASITAEYGNYDTKRIKGFFNIPLGDMFAFRLAGFFLDRDGFGRNDVNGHTIDGRRLYSTRATLSFKPNDKFSSFFQWEHFNEADNRSRIGKQVCIPDPGPASIQDAFGGQTATAPGTQRDLLSQGCKNGSIYGQAALGEVNTSATLGGLFGNISGLTSGNAFAGKTQDPNPYNIEAAFDPIYRSRQDIYVLNAEYNVTDDLKLTSLTSYNTFNQTTFEDYNRALPTQTFNDTPFSPGGVFIDPQVGASNRFRTFDYTDAPSNQITEEVRLQSNFKGKLNFSVGGIYLKFDTTTDYYVLSNTLTAASELFNAAPALAAALGVGSPEFIDPNFPPTGAGHNYYDNRTAYTLQSGALFGELYYQLTDDIKITTGIRYTDDKKKDEAGAVALFAPGQGLNFTPQKVEFQEVTGRANIEWSPHLSFTDKTIVYASYSRGYKGGGFNPPGSVGVAGASGSFQPEFINAYELGTKNTLLNGSLVLNGTFFYYDYSGYQVSQIINRTSVNSNIDATIYGAEFEGTWEPIRHLRFNSNIGLLHTEIAGGTKQIDVLNRTQNDPSLVVVKNLATTANCVANSAQVAALLSAVNTLQLIPNSANPLTNPLGGICLGLFTGPNNKLAALNLDIVPSEGKPANLSGHQLPNAPDVTTSVGAQYIFDLPNEITATLRGDFYYQDVTYARIFNTAHDRLHSYTNTNFSISFDKADWGLNLQLFVKNAFNNVVVTDSYLTDDSSGLFTNIFLNDPRTYGLSLTKTF